MTALLWQFWIYSFLGYLLEKAFAAATGATRRVRRCFLLLPMCPVYGLGVLAAAALPPALTESFWEMALWGGLAATAVEYLVHLWYERLLGVRFWDYSGVWGNFGGRVCLPFSAAWGLLLAAGVAPLQRVVVPLSGAVSPWITYGMLLVFTADALLSARYLRRTGEIESLSGVFW